MNKKYFLLIVFVIFTLFFAAFPGKAQTSNDWGHVWVTPRSGHWNYPGTYVLEALRAPLSVEWEIKCSYVRCPRELEFGSYEFTFVGEKIEVGWGHQCYAWQFDPIGRTGFIAEAEPWLCEEEIPEPTPTATPFIPQDTPTPAQPEPGLTPPSPAETPPGPTPTADEPTPIPGDPTPTPGTPADTPTPTPGAPADTPTPTIPPLAGQQPGPTPTPRLLLPVAGEMPYSPLTSPIFPALFALLLLGLAGRTVWTGILQADKAQVRVNISPHMRTQARIVLVLIGLSLLILAYLVWSLTGSRVPADLRDVSASNPPAAVPLNDQITYPGAKPIEQSPAVGLLLEEAPVAVSYNEEPSSAGVASVTGSSSLEALGGYQSTDNLPRPVSEGPSTGDGRAAYSALAGAYREETPKDFSPVTRLVIPVLNVDAEVRYIPFEDETWDVSELGLDIAWLGGTSSPGLESNTVLAGHVTAMFLGNGPFRYLNSLHPGDLVRVYTEWNVYTYAVREQMVVKPNDSMVVGATEKAQLTLITCTGWNDEYGVYTSRRAVFADLVSVDSLAEQDGQRWR
jgi:LPXTG-site transpeptidase (sortase) family protein